MKVLLCWSEKPFPSPEDLPDPGLKPGSLALQADSLLWPEPPVIDINVCMYSCVYIHTERVLVYIFSKFFDD